MPELWRSVAGSSSGRGSRKGTRQAASGLVWEGLHAVHLETRKIPGGNEVPMEVKGLNRGDWCPVYSKWPINMTSHHPHFPKPVQAELPPYWTHHPA